MVNLTGRLNECGVISPCLVVQPKDLEKWQRNLLPSGQFGKQRKVLVAGMSAEGSSGFYHRISTLAWFARVSRTTRGGQVHVLLGICVCVSLSVGPSVSRNCLSALCCTYLHLCSQITLLLACSPLSPIINKYIC